MWLVSMLVWAIRVLAQPPGRGTLPYDNMTFEIVIENRYSNDWWEVTDLAKPTLAQWPG